MLNTLTILLIALAISDILAPQANAFIGFSHYHLSKKFSNSINYLKYYDILRYIIHPLSTMFTMSSSWIVAIATFFRLIAVMWPFKARSLIDRKVAFVSLLIVFGIGLTSIIPIYYNLVPIVKCTSDNQQQYIALSLHIQSDFLQKAYIPLIHVMSFYLPWLISLILWIFLLRSLRQSEKNFNLNFTFSSKDSNIGLHSFNNSNSNTMENHQFKRDYTNGFLNEPVYQSSSSKLLNPNYRKTEPRLSTTLSESRVNSAQLRLRSTRYNKITLMVVVLCFTNLICRVFTFVFIFETIYNQYIRKDFNENEYLASNSTNMHIYEDAKMRFPKFLSYSLLLNNIFLCINHSCNILIYTFTNPRFKKNLISLFKHNFIWKKYLQHELQQDYNLKNNNDNNHDMVKANQKVLINESVKNATRDNRSKICFYFCSFKKQTNTPNQAYS